MMRQMRYALIWLLVTSLISGCTLFRGSEIPRSKGVRLAKEVARLPELDLSPVAAESGQTVKDLLATEAEVLAAYRAVYGKVGDPDQNRALGKRLADLELARAELLSAEGVVDNPFAPAVEIYEGLLANSVDAEGRDALLYQLAQSNDMAGDGDATEAYLNELIRDFPDSPYVLEARFRRGEMRFSGGDFDGAAQDYAYVTAAGDNTKYWLHASYMLGWSHFKGSDLDAAANQFYEVVGVTAPARVEQLTASTGDGSGGGVDSVPDESASSAAEGLQRELLDDALRVLMLTLNYEDGVQSLAADMREREHPEWQYLVYESLAGEYINQERYIDGVAAWQMFVDENPLDLRAPSATIGIIDVLAEADFPSEILPKKEEFVERYGVRSDFWAAHDSRSRDGYIGTLKQYLNELSQLRHAQAQTSGRTSDFVAAADYYEQTIESFPEDPKTGDTLFLLGDVYTDAAMPQQSLAAYQRLVNDFPDHPSAADAGYASILALDLLARAEPAADQPGWQAQRLAAQIDFAQLFPSDSRAPAVQAAAADRLFQNGAFEDAVKLAQQLLGSGNTLDNGIRDTSRLIVGHGSMELGEFQAAEAAYANYLNDAVLDAQQRDDIEERYLASVYKQGEVAEQKELLDDALVHYLRIAQLKPGAELAALAHYDAIAMIEATGNSTKLSELLVSFRDLYPNDQRSAEVPGRLAAMFEQQNDYSAAAEEYLNVAAQSGDAERSRQAQYLAAELFLKDGDKSAALREFQRYTTSFPEPFDAHMAALDAQDTLLEEQGASRLGVWQQKVALRDRSGRSSTDRMNYLAAEARLRLADLDRSEFDSLSLSQPLKRSLRAKQKSLKTTIAAYKQVIDYGVVDFVTAANFQIADMYVQLSRSIMESARPSGLSALELEQYEILLEEQAYPFEEQAIELHEVNLRRMWQGRNDDWTGRSLAALRVLMPGRFDKDELQVAYVDAIH